MLCLHGLKQIRLRCSDEAVETAEKVVESAKAGEVGLGGETRISTVAALVSVRMSLPSGPTLSAYAEVRSGSSGCSRRSPFGSSSALGASVAHDRRLRTSLGSGGQPASPP